MPSISTCPCRCALSFFRACSFGRRRARAFFFPTKKTDRTTAAKFVRRAHPRQYVLRHPRATVAVEMGPFVDFLAFVVGLGHGRPAITQPPQQQKNRKKDGGPWFALLFAAYALRLATHALLTPQNMGYPVAPCRTGTIATCPWFSAKRQEKRRHDNDKNAMILFFSFILKGRGERPTGAARQSAGSWKPDVSGEKKIATTINVKRFVNGEGLCAQTEP
nr:hypothetical protein [Pandoravirus massiliensis]